MKLGRLLRLGCLTAAGTLVYRVYKQYQADRQFELAPVSNNGTGNGSSGGGNARLSSGERRSVSPELLEILACPVDKKPVELIKDDQGREWLLNPRNGYRYPIEDGIPIMLIEEGEKNKDESLIRSA